MSVTRPSRTVEEFLRWMVVAAVGAVVVLVLAIWLALRVGATIDHRSAPARNPFAAVILLLAGKATWPGIGSAATVVLEVALLVAIGAAAARWRSGPARRLGVDLAVRHLASRRDHAQLSAERATTVARRLGVQAALPGVRVGLAITTGKPVYGSWEMTQADIWGARRGKTTSRVVPAIVDAPGAVVATSNKRDVVDTT